MCALWRKFDSLGACLWFSASGFGISDDGSISDAGITQLFCLVLVHDGENLVHYVFFLFLFLFLLFFIQSMLFCYRQLSALKRAKLHVLARMSATNLVILFTHFLLPCGHFSPWKNQPALSFKSVRVSARPSPEDHSPVFMALCKRNYIRVANIWQDMKEKKKVAVVCGRVLGYFELVSWACWWQLYSRSSHSF